MPLPDERHGKSVASLIGRFEQQTKKQLSSSPGPRSSSVVSHTTGDSAKEEVKERREWPPRASNVGSTPTNGEASKRELSPRLSRQNSGDSPGQRWPLVQPIIQATPFLEKSPTSPLAKGSGLATPPEDDKPPSPPAEIPKVIEVIPPSREPTLVEPDPPKPVEPEPVESPKTPPQPTITPPIVESGPPPAVTKSPLKVVKATPQKSNVKATSKPPPSSFGKGTSLLADANDRRKSASAHPPRPTSRTNLRSKTPTSTPGRPPSSAQRKPPTETPKHSPAQVKRPKTPSTSPRHPPSTPSKPPPVIPKTPSSRLYAPTAASLAKSANSPQPPPPERKKTLSSGASLERLSKPTASSLSKSRSAHSLTSNASPPRSKPTSTRTGTLGPARKSTTISKPGSRTKPTDSTPAETSVEKGDTTHEESHENGNGLEAEPSTIGEIEIESSDAESHGPEPDCEHEHFANGSLEASYTEEPLETMDEARVHDHEAVDSSVDQDYVEEPEGLVRSHSPESGDLTPALHVEGDASSEPPHEGDEDAAEVKRETANDDIVDMVGLLESTGFTSKHILQAPADSVANDLHTPGLEKERLKIGEIPDEE